MKHSMHSLLQELTSLVAKFPSQELSPSIQNILQEISLREQLAAKAAAERTYGLRVEVGGNCVLEWVDSGIERILGCDPSEIETHWQRHLHPEDYGLVQKHFELVMGGKSDACDLRMVNGEEEIRWIRNRAVPMWNTEKNRVARVHGWVQDITGEKYAEKAHRYSTDRLHLLMDRTPFGICWLNRNGELDWANVAACRLLGSSLEVMKGTSFAAMIKEEKEFAQKLQSFYGMVRETSWENEFHAAEEHGETLQITVSKIPVPMGELGALVFLRSVKTQKAEFQESVVPTPSWDAAPLAMLRILPDGTIEAGNDELALILGFTLPEEIDAFQKHLSGNAWVDVEGGRLFQILAKNCPVKRSLPMNLIKRDGAVLQVEIMCQAITESDDSFANGGLIACIHPVQKRNITDDARRFAMAVKQASDWIMITDLDGQILYMNDAVEQLSGFTRAESIGKKPSLWKSGMHDQKFFRNMYDMLLKGNIFRDIVINRRQDGEMFYLDQTVTPLKNERGEITHFVSTGKNITQQKKIEEKLNYLAYHDALTGLPNKNLLLDRISQGLARAAHNKRVLAMLVLDIDRFKFINETFGHYLGDSVLKEVARRLVDCTREGDTISRLANDEFGVGLLDMANSEDVILVVEKIMKRLGEPIKAGDEEIILTTSIGIALFPADGNDAQELFKNADMALSKTRHEGMNDYQFYTSDINVKASEFVMMQKRLFRAIQNEEFILYYQPLADINSRELVGMEVLIRWKHPELGMISPAKFIWILEETGMILEVGEWILKTACKQLQAWGEKGFQRVPVSVNFSTVQFHQKNLDQIILRTAREANVDPTLLTLEITESVFMNNLDSTCAFLKSIKDEGFSMSVDDFGTGYSSLSYLRRLPIDTLKIDISFIRDLATDPDAASIVTAIIAMAHSLNLKTVAEGVETDEQWRILRLLRCDTAQGYFFSPPVPPDQVEKFFKMVDA